MLIADLRNQKMQAMKNKDQLRSETLGLVLSMAVEDAKKTENRDPTESEIAAAFARLFKQYTDVRPDYASRPEMLADLDQKLAILTDYLPKQMTEDELESAIRSFVEANPGAKIGQIMGHLNGSYKGQFNGKVANQIVQKVTAA